MENNCPEDLDDLFCRGAEEALKALLKFNGIRALNWLRFHHGRLNRDELDDILADAIARTWQTYDPLRGSIQAWFFLMVKNRAAELQRYKKARPTTPIGLLDIEQRERSLSSEEYEELHYCISQLPEKQRRVILEDIEAGGLVSNKELAVRMRVSSAAVSNLRSRAYNGLKKLFRRRDSA